MLPFQLLSCMGFLAGPPYETAKGSGWAAAGCAGVCEAAKGSATGGVDGVVGLDIPLLEDPALDTPAGTHMPKTTTLSAELCSRYYDSYKQHCRCGNFLRIVGGCEHRICNLQYTSKGWGPTSGMISRRR